MLATLASAADARPLAPPGAADAPTLDLYVGEERRTTITTTNFGTATEALAAAVLRAGDPGDAVEGRVVLAARIGGEAFEFVDPPSSALRPGDALSLERETVAEEALDADRLAAEIGGYGNTSSDEERERRRKKRAKGRRPPPKRPAPGPVGPKITEPCQLCNNGIPANVTFVGCKHAAHETCLAQVGVTSFVSRGVAAICPICAAGDLGVDVAKPMHYALRPEAAIRAGGSKQRRNHHAQSKVPMDAHGRYPCLRKCGRTFGHAPAAIAHTKTCKCDTEYNGPNLPKELRPDAAPNGARPAEKPLPPYNPRIKLPAAILGLAKARRRHREAQEAAAAAAAAAAPPAAAPPAPVEPAPIALGVLPPPAPVVQAPAPPPVAAPVVQAPPPPPLAVASAPVVQITIDATAPAPVKAPPAGPESESDDDDDLITARDV